MRCFCDFAIIGLLHCVALRIASQNSGSLGHQSGSLGHHPMGSSNASHISHASSASMTGAYSPGVDPTDIPGWFGHSLNTIHNHPDAPSADNPFDLFDDDNKTNGAAPAADASTQLKLMNVSTNDILFEDSDAASSPKSGISHRSNLSPTKARNLKVWN